jgi:hypothetical protein
MDRIAKIANRITEGDMGNRVAFFVLAKKRPDDLFAGKFFDVRKKIKELKGKWSEDVRAGLEKTLINDLKGRKNIQFSDFKLSLGQYRGSKFVTSAKFKAKIKSMAIAEQFLAYLQKKYSPKYKMKNVVEAEDGTVTADFNIR